MTQIAVPRFIYLESFNLNIARANLQPSPQKGIQRQPQYVKITEIKALTFTIKWQR